MPFVLQDAQYGLRLLLRGRGFTVVAVLSLALGIGANSAIFSAVDTVLLRPLPYREPQDLVRLWTVNPNKRPAPFGASYPDFLDWVERSRSFSHLSGLLPSCSFNLLGEQPERVPGACASASLLPGLGIKPVLGRNFLPEEDRGRGVNVALLGYGLWQTRFGGDRSLLGDKVVLDGVPYTIVGILPSDFRSPIPSPEGEPQVIVPLALVGWENRSGRPLPVLGRLAPGISRERAEAEMGSLSEQLEREYPESNTGFRVQFVPLQEQIVGEVRPTLLALLGAVGLVLLIACVNLANLLLARSMGRNQEIAVRASLGAAPGRLVRQLLVESLTLALLGGLVGLLLAWWGLKALVALGPADLPRLQDTALDMRMLAFTLLISIAAGLLFGLAPALHTRRVDFIASLKGRGTTPGRWHGRFRYSLVTSEVALATLLLIGAGWLTKSLLRLQQVDPGFQIEGVLTAQVPLTSAKYEDPVRREEFFVRLLQRLATTQEVEVAGAVSQLPLSGDTSSSSFYVEGRPKLSRAESPQAEVRVVWPHYFRTLDIPLLQGRDFTDADRQEDPGVAIVNQDMADRFWPGEDPLGRRLTLFMDSVPRQVVGVVGNVRHFGPEAEGRPEIYVPFSENQASPALTLVVRTAGDPLAAVGLVRQAVAEIDREQPIVKVRTMEELLTGSLAQARFRTALISLFALAALALSGIGIYGVLVYLIHQTRHEIAIRMALGATPSAIFRMVARQALVPVGLGMALGAGTAFLLAGSLSDLLFQVGIFDLGALASAAVLLFAVSLAAVYLPARRATRTDPILALR